MKKLQNKVAIVTGAGAGIGKGIARRFALEGAVIAICDVREDALKKTAEELIALGARVVQQVCDVTSNKQIDTFVETVIKEAGQIDILVNNVAHFAAPHSFEDWSDADYLRVMDGGVNSAFRFMKQVFPHMKTRGGKILNMTSMAGLRGVKGSAGYNSAKTAIIGLSRSAANDWGQYNITVNCLAPMAMTEAWQAIMKTLPEGTDPCEAINIRSNALGYIGDPEKDIAPAAVFLCSDDANYITGTIMPVDGGLMDLE